MNRFRLVELIGVEKEKLSSKGRELWEELETLLIMSWEEESALGAQESKIVDQMSHLPAHEQSVLNVLTELRGGLYDSDYVKRRGESGEPHRVRGVINAALIKDRDEREPGRSIQFEDLNRYTVDQAPARLKEDG